MSISQILEYVMHANEEANVVKGNQFSSGDLTSLVTSGRNWTMHHAFYGLGCN